MASRHDSYNEAIECNSSSTSLNSAGVTRAHDRGGWRGSGSETSSERSASVKGSVVSGRRKGVKDGGREGGRRASMQRQAVLGLSAVHEETSDSQTESVGGANLVTKTTTRVRGGVTQISTGSAQSTV